MDSQVTFEKQNLHFDADPSIAHPTAEVLGHDVLLKFPIKNPERNGEILFTECLIYRIGSPNDEGFYGYGFNSKIKNDSVYSLKSFPDLEFGYFYKVTGLDWKKSISGKGTVIVDAEYMNKTDFLHFVFFMKDGSFECLAKTYEVQQQKHEESV